MKFGGHETCDLVDTGLVHKVAVVAREITVFFDWHDPTDPQPVEVTCRVNDEYLVVNLSRVEAEHISECFLKAAHETADDPDEDEAEPDPNLATEQKPPPEMPF